MDSTRPKVAVIMGSKSDKEVMERCLNTLEALGIPYEAKVLSAHRSPEETRAYCVEAAKKGIEVIIAGAGWAAHLAGVIASYTTLPVIGVPIDSSVLKGLDALLSTVQMPPGIPVATVAIGPGGATNAAVLAAQILAVKYEDLKPRLEAYRQELRAKVLGDKGEE